MCFVSEKSRSNESHSIEGASFDERAGHWKIARSGYITTERDGYFEEFVARSESEVKIAIAYSSSAQSRGSVSDSAINLAPSND